MLSALFLIRKVYMCVCNANASLCSIERKAIIINVVVVVVVVVAIPNVFHKSQMSNGVSDA